MAKKNGMQQRRCTPQISFPPDQADCDEAGTNSRTSEIELQHYAIPADDVKLAAASITVTRFARPTKPRIYSDKEWEAMRSRIHDLYIIKNRSLFETGDFLARKDGFNATLVADW